MQNWIWNLVKKSLEQSCCLSTTWCNSIICTGIVPQLLSASVYLSIICELLLYYCCTNMNNWINRPLIMKEIVWQSHSTRYHYTVWINPIIIPPRNSHFFTTQKSVGLYSAHYGNIPVIQFIPHPEWCMHTFGPKPHLLTKYVGHILFTCKLASAALPHPCVNSRHKNTLKFCHTYARTESFKYTDFNRFPAYFDQLPQDLRDQLLFSILGFLMNTKKHFKNLSWN